MRQSSAYSQPSSSLLSSLLPSLPMSSRLLFRSLLSFSRFPVYRPSFLSFTAVQRFHSSVLALSAPNPNGDFVPRPQVRERVFKILRGIKKVDQARLSEDAKFSDLGLDSLDTVEVVIQLEEEFNVEIYDPIAAEITTVKKAIDVLENMPFAQQLNH